MSNIADPTQNKQEKSTATPARLQVVPSSFTPTPLLSLLDFGDHDHGNARRLISRHGSEIRYCHAIKKWLLWDGRRWLVDTTGQIKNLAVSTITEYERELKDVSAGKERMQTAASFLNERRIESMLIMTQHELPISPEHTDTHADLLNFRNGTVNLRSARLLPHTPAHFITRLIHHNYKSAATCPVFLSFLSTITNQNSNLVSYLQRAFGYTLTAHTSEKAVFLPWGDGDNGKSTLLTTIFKLVSEYACLMQIDTLMSTQDTSNAQADLADLRGARFVMTSETGKGQRLAVGKLKRITQGMGGRIKTSRKYENPIEFDETQKIWIDANLLPIVLSEDSAIWNRLHPIPFTVTIPKSEQDKELQNKLLAEAEGILAWIVEGARLWRADGLGRPPEVRKAVDAWRANSDPVSCFFALCCIVGGADDVIPSADLYASYMRWCHAEGEAPLAKRVFLESAGKQPGVKKDHKRHGNVYLRVRLRKFGGRIGSRPEEQEDQDGDGDDDSGL